MLGILFLLFTVVPAVELYLLIQVGSVIGVLETIWIIVLTGVVGAWAAKTQGRLVLMQVQQASARGEVPSKKLVEGLMILVGGILLITPGFMTDIFGLSLVFPLTRKLLAFFVMNFVKKQIQNGKMNFHFSGFSTGNGTSGASWSTHSTEFYTSGPRGYQGVRDVTPQTPESISSKDEN